MGGPCPYQSSKYLPPLRVFAGAATGGGEYICHDVNKNGLKLTKPEQC